MNARTHSLLLVLVIATTAAGTFAQDVQTVTASAGNSGPNVNTPTESASQVRPADEPPPTVTSTPSAVYRGSLFREAASSPIPVSPDGTPMGSAPVNFIAVQAPRPKKFKKNDVMTIVVQEDSDYTSNAQNQSEKQQDFDIAIQNMVQAKLQNGFLGLGSVGNPATLPEAKFHYDNKRNNQASNVRTDSFSVRISATVVDVKPNGTIVVEAVKQIKVDREIQTFRLSGICRAEDVTPDNTVLSTQLANLTVSKQTTGEVKDGTKRGWLNGLIDKFGPF